VSKSKQNEVLQIEAQIDQAEAMLRDRLAGASEETLDEIGNLADLCGHMGGEHGRIAAMALYLMTGTERLRRGKNSAGLGDNQRGTAAE
jgi:hypothetical protein